MDKLLMSAKRSYVYAGFGTYTRHVILIFMSRRRPKVIPVLDTDASVRIDARSIIASGLDDVQ